MDGRRWATYGRREGPSPERSHQVTSKGANPSMRKHRYIALTALFALVVGACSSSTPSSAPAATTAPAASATDRGLDRAQRVRRRRHPSAAVLAPDPAEAVIHGRRAERRDQLLDVLPVADLRPVHQGHDRPLRGDLSGRQGQVGRPPGHLPGRPQQRVRRGHRARTSSTCRSARAGSATTRARACCSASTARSRRPSRTSTSRASGTSSWSTARTSSSRGTRASTSS